MILPLNLLELTEYFTLDSVWSNKRKQANLEVVRGSNV